MAILAAPFPLDPSMRLLALTYGTEGDTRPLVMVGDQPLGRVGRLAAPMSLGEFAIALHAALPGAAGGLRVAAASTSLPFPACGGIRGIAGQLSGLTPQHLRGDRSPIEPGLAVGVRYFAFASTSSRLRLSSQRSPSAGGASPSKRTVTSASTRAALSAPANSCAIAFRP